MASKHYNGSLYRKIAKKKATLSSKDCLKIILSYLFQLEILQIYSFSAKKKLSNGEYCDFCIRRDSLKGDPEKLKHICKHINRLKFLEKPEKMNPILAIQKFGPIYIR